MTLETLARTDTLDARVAMEIKLLLTKRGQNQAGLARAMGVPPMWVSDRLRGRVQWTLVDLARVAETLGIHVVDLVGRAEKGPDGSYVSVGSRAVDVTQHFAEITPKGDQLGISGLTPHPGHPVLAGAITIPPPRPSGPLKTSPTGR